MFEKKAEKVTSAHVEIERGINLEEWVIVGAIVGGVLFFIWFLYKELKD